MTDKFESELIVVYVCIRRSRGKVWTHLPTNTCWCKTKSLLLPNHFLLHEGEGSKLAGLLQSSNVFVYESLSGEIAGNGLSYVFSNSHCKLVS